VDYHTKQVLLFCSIGAKLLCICTCIDKIAVEENRRLTQYVNYEFGHGKMKCTDYTIEKTPRIMTYCFDTYDDIYFECRFNYHSQRLTYERRFEGSLVVRPIKIKKIFEDNLIIKKKDGNCWFSKKE
jgi:hypothetical protein